VQIIRFFFILFMFPLFLGAQQKTKIILKDSSRGTTTKAADGGTVSYVKNPVFQHLSAILTCDSAVFYETRNVFEAFNNVHINQNDTINIYSDHLTYDGNTKIAHLTSNVRMIDNKSTLTTNILDYNTGTKIGTYVNGGKIVNKDVTITSTNGYYFSNSKDAYFRYNAVAVSPKVRITSDTLRYNTGTNWAYFYGPTNIKGKDDNLYTENGAYNTKTEYAYFGKKNLYTTNSKSLKGDSLYYDGIAGYGKAVRNIVFRDTSDKTVLYGQKGYYYKKTERAVVTDKAYVGMGSSDSIKVNDKLVPDTLWMGADTLETQMVLQKNLKLIESPILKKDNELGDAEDEKREAAEMEGSVDPKTLNTKKTNVPATVGKSPGKKSPPGKLTKDSTATDSLPARDTLASDSLSLSKVPIKKDDIKAATDSLKAAVPDSVTRPVDTLAKQTLSSIKPDSTSKKAVDSLVRKTTDVIKATTTGLKDSVVTPMDTIKTRSIKAYHKVRVFKANMQAVADSLFYTNADSTLRWYGNPILWSQGSQQTGDTIYLRLKNKKLNTLQVLQNGFLVNVYADSAKFNQIKGKLITAFFKDGELSTMFVDGNAESVYYGKGGKDSTYTDMNQTVSSRIKIKFLNKEITNILTIKKPEAVRIPVAELKEDVLLTGFTWKPELRPLSKKEVINGKTKTQLAKKSPAPAAKNPPTKSQATKPKSVIGAARTLINDQLNKNNLDTIPPNLIDTNKVDTEKVKQEIKKADSVIKKLSPVPLKKP
jgi:lipopolysaccharide export system protein LptA